jgi:metallophosphoesterase superfamily enzyme
MTRDRLVLVISDLHMGVPPLDDFDGEVEQHLAAFLAKWRDHAGPVEIVINGDMLDFVQARPFEGADLESETSDGVPLCFTEAQSLQKLDAITTHHAKAFDALGDFLSGGDDKHVTILPGNHDADFFWSDVRAAFVERVCGDDASRAGRLRFHLETVYRPVGHEHLWIEHGHQFDPINRFFVGERPCWSEREPPIFTSATGARRLYECLGTRFMLRYLNRLDRDYPLMDNVKPFGRFFRIFGASAFTPHYGPLKVAVVLGAAFRYFGATFVTRRKDVMEQPESIDYDLPLKEAVAAASDVELRLFTDALERAGFPYERSPKVMLEDPDWAPVLTQFVAEHPDVVDALEPSPVKGVMQLIDGITVDETHDLLQAADGILREPSNRCRFVTMGHTHGRHVGDWYFNTGCWTRYLKFRTPQPVRLDRGSDFDAIDPESWELLRTGSYSRFPYTLDVLESRCVPEPAVTMTPFRERDWD